MTLYIVIDIGCLECHDPSNLVGIYPDRQEALATGAVPAEKLTEYDSWRGQQIRVLFEGEVRQDPPPTQARPGVTRPRDPGSEAPRSASERTRPVNPYGQPRGWLFE